MRSLCFSANGKSDKRTFTPLASQVLTVWCLGWLMIFAIHYVELTWRFVAELNGIPWILVISPSFWIWLAVFSVSLWALERLARIAWHEYEERLSLEKVGAVILAFPFLLWLGLVYVTPYVYPAVEGTLRLVPLIGGRGF